MLLCLIGSLVNLHIWVTLKLQMKRLLQVTRQSVTNSSASHPAWVSLLAVGTRLVHVYSTGSLWWMETVQFQVFGVKVLFLCCGKKTFLCVCFVQTSWMSCCRGRIVSCTFGQWGRGGWTSASSMWCLSVVPNRFVTYKQAHTCSCLLSVSVFCITSSFTLFSCGTVKLIPHCVAF